MSEIRGVYHVEATPLGYMPLPEVYSALDFALSLARGEGPEAEAAKAFMLTWYADGSAPSVAQVAQNAQAMRDQINALTDAYRATLTAFVDRLADHSCPLPGTPFGDYFADLAQVRSDTGS